jgi:hypothetical protein
VGVQVYDVVILPNLKTIRSTTLTLLKSFSKGGGRIIVAGLDASLVDVEPSTLPRTLPAHRVPFTQASILKALNEFRELKVTLNSGTPPNTLLYHLRADGDERYLFICNTDRARSQQCRIDLRGDWSATLLDTLSGKSYRFDTTIFKGCTRFNYLF